MTDIDTSKLFDFREFWDLTICYGKELYHKTTFDKVNASLLYGRLTEPGDSDDLAIVLPNDPSVTPMLVLESLVSLLKLDVLLNTKKVLTKVKPGDNVGIIDNRIMKPGIYMGIEEEGGTVRHCVKFDTFTQKIPVSREWRIQPYHVSMTTKKKRSSIVLGKKLEELMQLPPGGLMAFQNSKALVVSSDKSRIIDSFKEFTIDGDRLDNIFPMVNWTNVEQSQSIGQNNLRREAVLGFVSNTDLAVDIALRDPAIRLIIIDGASKVKDYSSIELLNSDKYPRKIICTLKSTDIQELETLDRLGFDCWVWRREDFQRMPEVAQTRYDQKGIFSLHNTILNALGGEDPIYKEVRLSTEIIKTMSGIKKQLQKLTAEIDTKDGGLLLRWAYSIYYALLQLPMSINSFHNYLDLVPSGSMLRLDNKMFELQRSFQKAYGISIRTSLKEECESLLSDIQAIYDLLEESNPKEKELMQIINNNYYQSTDIIFGKQEYAAAFKHRHNLPDSINATTQFQMGLRPKKLGIITGWSNYRMATKCFLAPYKKMVYLGYLSELNSHRNAGKKSPTAGSSSVDKNLRKNLNYIIKNKPEETSPNADSFASLDNLFDELKVKFGEDLFRENISHSQELVSARKVVLEDESYIYLTSSHAVDKLDREKKTSRRCTIDQLSVDDEIIFANSERSLFDELIAIIKESEDYQDLSTKASIWRKALETYALKNNLDEKDISDQLKTVGCVRSPGTIQMWFDGLIIGPSLDNYHAIRAINELTKDELLADNLEQTIAACKQLHAMHVKTGRALVGRIINATIHSEDEDMDEKIKSKIDLYATNAKVLPVVAISDQELKIPSFVVGKLRSL